MIEILSTFVLFFTATFALHEHHEHHEHHLPLYPPDDGAKRSTTSWKLIVQESEDYKYSNGFFFHLHIPKTGGTHFQRQVINVWQGNNCGIGYESWPYNDFSKTGSKDFSIPRYFDDRSCKVLTFETNFYDLEKYIDIFYKDKYGKRNTTNRDLLVFSFIRSPMDHIRSLIAQEHMTHRFRLNNGFPDDKRAKRCLNPSTKLRDYYDATSPETSCSGYTMTNTQVRALGIGSISKAKHTVDSIFGLGLASHYEEAVCLFSYQLGQFNGEACSCQAINHYRSTTKHKEWISKKGLFQINDDDIKRIEQITSKDQILHSYAARLFYKRIMLVQDLTNVTILCPWDWLHGLQS